MSVDREIMVILEPDHDVVIPLVISVGEIEEEEVAETDGVLDDGWFVPSDDDYGDYEEENEEGEEVERIFLDQNDEVFPDFIIDILPQDVKFYIKGHDEIDFFAILDKEAQSYMLYYLIDDELRYVADVGTILFAKMVTDEIWEIIE